MAPCETQALVSERHLDCALLVVGTLLCLCFRRRLQSVVLQGGTRLFILTLYSPLYSSVSSPRLPFRPFRHAGPSHYPVHFRCWRHGEGRGARNLRVFDTADLPHCHRVGGQIQHLPGYGPSFNYLLRGPCLVSVTASMDSRLHPGPGNRLRHTLMSTWMA